MVIKRDGNGGYNIQRGTFAAITLLIMLLSVIGTVVAYGVTLKTDVDYLKSESIDGVQNHKDLVDKIEQNQMTIIQNQERVLAMNNDIKEIKSDIKELIK